MTSSRLAGLLVLTGLAMFWRFGTPDVPPVAAQTPPTTCLSGDPFRLGQIVQIISSTSPVTVPQQISPQIAVEFVRQGSMAEAGDDLLGPESSRPAGAAAPAEPAITTSSFGPVRLRIFNSANQLEYRLTLSETLLSTIYQCHQAAGLTSAGGPADFDVIDRDFLLHFPVIARDIAALPRPLTPNSSLAPDGWSNASDTRTLRAPGTRWPLRAIAQASSPGTSSSQESLCTFALVGPRHLLSAAHCLVNQGSASWKSVKLTPGRDGTGPAPYGSALLAPGAAAGSWYVVPDEWVDPGAIEFYQWDWGLVIVPDRLGDMTGWFGYGALNVDQLRREYLVNRGYPDCDPFYPERPNGCQTARIYGDTRPCLVGGFLNPGANGWNRRMSVSCDLSRGQGGSPIYAYLSDPVRGKLTPSVIGVVSTHLCLTCAQPELYPNYARRITPDVLGKISTLREMLP